MGFIFEIDFEGVQTNQDDYEKQVLSKGAVYDKMILYESRPDEQKFNDPYYLQLLEKAVSDQDASYSFGVDKIYRKIDEYFEANSQYEKTIEYWEKAIEVNPKVGIARKLENIKKKHAG